MAPVAALPGAVPNGSCTRRRGRGATGDAPEYRLERGYQDVADVVDTVAAAAGNR
jgi:hypothetical protein